MGGDSACQSCDKRLFLSMSDENWRLRWLHQHPWKTQKHPLWWPTAWDKGRSQRKKQNPPNCAFLGGGLPRESDGHSQWTPRCAGSQIRTPCSQQDMIDGVSCWTRVDTDTQSICPHCWTAIVGRPGFLWGVVWGQLRTLTGWRKTCPQSVSH